MEDLIKDFLKKKNIFAVIGVSRDSNKYGNRVYFSLKRFGYKVFAVNPNINNINGDLVYPNLSSLPEKPDVIDIVVPPKIALNVVKEVKKLGINKVWLQPGSESKDIIDYCNINNIKLVHSMCVMIESARYLNGY